jgi:broad specificity phosphatase PhoE
VARPDEPPDPSVIMIIRHGEKPLHDGDSPEGILPNGKQDPQSLTVYGWVRAGALIELFAPSWGEPPAGLHRPSSIYAASCAGGRSKRALQTVLPLAARLGVPVVHRFGHGDEKHIANELASRSGVSVVSWHHEGITKLVQHLGEVRPEPPQEWPEDRYDMVWVFTRDGHAWRFDQVPQLLVSGDLPYPIAADAEQ